MTLEEQSHALLSLFSARLDRDARGEWSYSDHTGMWSFCHNDSIFEDLNAVQILILSKLNLDSSQRNWDYARHLGEITGSGEHITTALIHASAEQRLEAILKTYNLWKL